MLTKKPTGRPKKVPDSLIGKERLSFVRRCLVAAPKTEGKYHLVLGTPESIKSNSFYKRMPGRQNKHHGRQPGSYKRKRDIIRRSRRVNRG